MQKINEFNELNCVYEIDYSKIAGKYILPFTIALDFDTSIIYPENSERQRFCYTITGNGSLDPIYIDLDHIIFTIGADIAPEEITNIIVSVDGIKQNITFGEDGNVLMLNPGGYNSEDDCEGLKFDFGLDKTNGIMSVSFDLLNTYPIGQMEVVLFGRDTIAKGLSICGPVNNNAVTKGSFENYIATGYQNATVSVPVTITPFVNVGPTKTYLCGDGLILSGINTCPGTPNGTCRFTITQNICVEIPIEIGGNASIGDVEAIFDNITTDNSNVIATDNNLQAKNTELGAFDNKTIKDNTKFKPFFKKISGL